MSDWRDMFQQYVPPAPQPVRETSRSRMWEALDRRCGICGSTIRELSEVTLDHVIPRARNGANYGNLVPAHPSCNFAKADRSPTACEMIMLDALNTKMGVRFDAFAARTAFSGIMAEAFARVGAA